MSTYTEILDADIAPGQPAFSTVMTRLRENPIAIAQGDATVPATSKIVAGAAFKQPTSASQTQILAHQGEAQLLGDNNGTIRFFLAVVVVPGVYTFAGTCSATFNASVTMYVNDVDDGLDDSTSAFTHQMTLAAGDRIRVDIESSASNEITLTDFRLLSEFIVPMAQCQFNRFKSDQSAS
jgi:hypothetical protein